MKYRVKISNFVFGIPLGFLGYKYNPEQFELVAFRKGEDGKDLVFTRERERECSRTSEYSFEHSDSWHDKECRRKNKRFNYLCSYSY